MLALGDRPAGAWRPPIVKTVARAGEGVDELVEEIGKHRAWLEPSRASWSSGGPAAPATRSRRSRVTALRRRWDDVHARVELDDLAAAVVAGDTDPYAAADRLIESL